VVNTEGDIGDILFELPPSSHRLEEGNILTVTLAGGSLVTYKVESVGYHLVELDSANTFNPHNFWKPPTVYYGVSIVP